MVAAPPWCLRVFILTAIDRFGVICNWRADSDFARVGRAGPVAPKETHGAQRYVQ
jgi:hypothetical protein